MKKIIVDTNIIFSCLLNSQGAIGDLIFNSNQIFHFYSNDYMRFEIHKHWEKLLNISKLRQHELQSSFDKMLIKLNFINEQLIPENIWKNAETLVQDIDVDDTDFIALTKFLKGSLWTGDKPLYNGLKAKGFKTVYTTTEIINLRKKLMKQ